MAPKGRTTDEYLAALSADKRAALEQLRVTIRKLVPNAEECISYGLPAFRLDGQVLVGFGAGKDHCAFYPMSGRTVAALEDDLARYETSKGTIRFPIGNPLPASLVRKIVKARIAENAAQPQKRAQAEKPGKKSPKKAARTGTAASSDVEAFIAGLQHPLVREVRRIRDIILDAAPGVAESIKWNAPSFSTSEHFATFHLREPDSIQVVLHLGAKARPDAGVRAAIPDPESLLQWRAADRAIVTFRDLRDVEAKRAAFARIVRQWVAFV